MEEIDRIMVGDIVDVEFENLAGFFKAEVLSAYCTDFPFWIIAATTKCGEREIAYVYNPAYIGKKLVDRASSAVPVV